MPNLYIKNSKNQKLGNDCDAIYSPIENTCDKNCPLKDKGCYAQNSYCGYINKKLEKYYKGCNPLQIARLIASEIDRSYDIVPHFKKLRLFVSGDSRTIKGTRVIAKAVKKWQERGGGICWNYTHAWKHVPRKEWGTVSVLASVDCVSEVDKARENGYAPAIVVSEHLSEKVYSLPNSDVKWIPCPNNTRNVTCEKCKLCFNEKRLFEGNFGIAFAVHGVRKNLAKKRLNVI